MATTVTIEITAELAKQLWWRAGKNFIEDQNDRFEHLTPDSVPYGPDFANGSMMWCKTGADAILLLAYERACGYSATLLWDLATAQEAQEKIPGAYVVLSQRPLE